MTSPQLDPTKVNGDPIHKAKVTDPSRHYIWIAGLIRGLQFLIDVLALVIAFWLGFLARQIFPLFPLSALTPSFRGYSSMLLIYTLTLLLIFFLARLYHQRRAA